MISNSSFMNALNKIRSNPTLAITELKSQLNKFQNNNVYRNNQGQKIRTLSGKVAWQDAILALERQKSKNQLIYSQLLENASKSYLKEISSSKQQQQQSKINPYDVIKNNCSYTGNINFYLLETDADKNVDQIIAQLIVGDCDEKKVARVALFHPMYKVFGCQIVKRTAKIIIFIIFAQSVDDPNINQMQNRKTQGEMFKNVNKQQSNSNYSSFSPSKQSKQKLITFESKPKNIEQQKQFSITQGKLLIAQLNKIRKDPKNYIHKIKKQLQNFSDQTTLKVQFAGNNSSDVILKEGKAAYYDLISELQTQYPLPSIKEVYGLSLTAWQQVVELEKIKIKENRSVFEDIMKKYVCESDAVKSFKLTSVNDWPVEAIVMGLLVSDNDKKRSIRRKLMSPITKVIGCCVRENVVVVNAGDCGKDSQHAKEIREKVETGGEDLSENISKSNRSQISESGSVMKWNHNGHQNNNNKKMQKVMTPNFKNEMNRMGEEERTVVKKTCKTSYKNVKGRQYKINEVKILYENGEVEEYVDEQLMQQ